MFPLSTVLFPFGVLPLHVFEPRYRTMTTDVLAGDRQFGVVLIERGSEVGGGDCRLDVGTVARVEAARRFDDGRWALVAVGVSRCTVVRWLEDDPYPRAEVEVDSDPTSEPASDDLAEAEAAVRRTRALLSELADTPAVPADLDLGAGSHERVWKLCELAPLSAHDRQILLEADDPRARLARLTSLTRQVSDDLSRLLAGAMDGDVDHD